MAHDAHNIVVVGMTDGDLARCVERLAEIGGGIAIYEDGEPVEPLGVRGHPFVERLRQSVALGGDRFLGSGQRPLRGVEPFLGPVQASLGQLAGAGGLGHGGDPRADRGDVILAGGDPGGHPLAQASVVGVVGGVPVDARVPGRLGQFGGPPGDRGDGFLMRGGGSVRARSRCAASAWAWSRLWASWASDDPEPAVASASRLSCSRSR